MSDRLTLGELFAGVGGFSLGFEAAGWETRWQVEWDPHCQNVLRRHWPHVDLRSDVSTVNGRTLEPVDCITFGSPCQDLSVAGKRAGLQGERSGLFFEAMRIIKEMRDATDGTRPRFALWENVPGALSSNAGRDFAAVLDSLAELGAMDIGWRVLDAQHFGVPQRRRRVFVVADLGGRCAGSLLLEPSRLRWNPQESRAARTPAPGAAASGAGAGGSTSADLSEGEVQSLFGENSISGYSEAVATLRASGGSLGHGSENLVVNVEAAPAAGVFGMSQFAGYTEGVTTLTNTSFKRPEENIIVSAAQPVLFETMSMFEENWAEAEVKNALRRGESRMFHAVLEPQQEVFVKAKRASSSEDDESWRADGIAPTLNAFENASEGRATVIVPSMNLRRLMPIETERLMGWPDDHTRWRADGTEQSDTQRFRQCGNGVASPVAAWIAAVLSAALAEEAGLQ